MKVTILLGTARQDNKSSFVAKELEQRLAEKVTVEYASVSDYLDSFATITPWEDISPYAGAVAWREQVVSSDVLVFVIPEYNHSFPGEWKLLMDTLKKEYFRKKTFVATVSSGDFAGVRVMEQLLPVFSNFAMDVQPERLHIPHVQDMFDDTGVLIDDKTAERIEDFCTAISAALAD